MDEDDGLTEYEDLFKRLCAATVIRDGVIFSLLTTADEDVVARAVLSKEDIVSAALASDQAEEVRKLRTRKNLTSRLLRMLLRRTVVSACIRASWRTNRLYTTPSHSVKLIK